MDKNRDQKKEILLVPIGKVLVDILGEIAVALRKTYKYHVHIGRSEEPATEAYSDERRQYVAPRLLDLVQMRKRENIVCVLGIVDGDMYAGEKSFLFGLGSEGKGGAVVALARLREEYYRKPAKSELFLRRAVTESIYQAGLAMGLPVCVMKQCVMAPSASLWRLDTKGQTLCETCQRRLDDAQGIKTESAIKKSAEKSEDEGDDQPQEEMIADLGAERSRSLPEDESELPAELVEPRNSIPAETAAMHTESDSPEEPLVADSHRRE